jgi:TDG/mug DNA glycosylase family protein
MDAKPVAGPPMTTLPDYLAPGLDIVFVGLNPGLQSVEAGHYFASPRNRFWTAVNRSGLLIQDLDATRDAELMDQGIGLTDVVKRPTRGASDLRAGDFRTGAPELKARLEGCAPLIVCFHGVTAYRNYLRHVEGLDVRPELGLQPRHIGRSAVFVVPNPSPANAVYSLRDLVGWYRCLKELRVREKTP